MAAQFAKPAEGTRAAAILAGPEVAEEEAGAQPAVRVLVVTMKHAALPRGMAEDPLVVEALFGREGGAGSWPLAAEVRGAAAAFAGEEDPPGARCRVELGAAAVAFPWRRGVDSTLRLRLTQPPLRSAVADVLLEVPLSDADAGARVSREVTVPLRCCGGRWSAGSVALDLELRLVSADRASELFCAPAPAERAAWAFPGTSPLPAVEKQAVLPQRAGTVPPGVAAPPVSTTVEEPETERPVLPLLLRRRPGAMAHGGWPLKA